MPPKVSVLLPVHNGEAFLSQALDSLRAQSFRHFEVVAVDDGSTDGTPAMLRAYARRDPRIRYFRIPRSGLVHALIAGLARCRAPLVARMDADDVAHPHRLAKQIAYLEARPSVALCGTRVEIFAATPLSEGLRRYQAWINRLVDPGDILRDLFVECPIPHPTFLFRRSRIQALGGYRDTGGPEDYDLLLRLFAAGEALGKVPEVLLRWRDHPRRHSRTHARYSRKAFLRTKAHYLARTVLARSPAVLWGTGGVGRFLSRALLQEGVRLDALVDIAPAKWGRKVRGLPVIPPHGLSAYPGRVIVGAVGTRGAREQIRAWLLERGYRETRDFWMAA